MGTGTLLKITWKILAWVSGLPKAREMCFQLALHECSIFHVKHKMQSRNVQIWLPEDGLKLTTTDQSLFESS